MKPSEIENRTLRELPSWYLYLHQPRATTMHPVWAQVAFGSLLDILSHVKALIITLLSGESSGRNTLLTAWSRQKTPMEQSPIRIWSWLGVCCTWRHCLKHLTFVNVLS